MPFLSFFVLFFKCTVKKGFWNRATSNWPTLVLLGQWNCPFAVTLTKWSPSGTGLRKSFSASAFTLGALTSGASVASLPKCWPKSPSFPETAKSTSCSKYSAFWERPPKRIGEEWQDCQTSTCHFRSGSQKLWNKNTPTWRHFLSDARMFEASAVLEKTKKSWILDLQSTYERAQKEVEKLRA